ncbi:MAG: hypothetical protein HY859_15425 [Caulobacterales bacterium]|nr:hypothetical protein [Caulobacterales bacterium]
MQDDPDAQDKRRRVMEAATGVYFVPAYQGHWVAAVLFAATMVGATMLWSCLPAAMAILGGGATGAANGQTAATFLTLYAAMAAGPIAGWTLWGFRRRWAALALMALFAFCVVWLGPAATR